MNNILRPLFHLVFVLLCFLTQFPVLSRCCREYDRNALLSFKSSLSDFSNRLSSWRQGNQSNCCNWQGVRCSNNSFHVVALDLRNTNGETELRNEAFNKEFEPFKLPTTLNGTISPSLFNLTHLQYLDLSFNYFQSSTEINHGFANLKKLTHLDLANSGLSTSITTQLANLSSLRYLDLSCAFDEDNAYGYLSFSSCQLGLGTSTNWLRGLVNLKVLRLKGVDLSQVSSTSKNWAEPISYLSNLRELDLSKCNIFGMNPINDQFLNLSRLSSLRMSSNYDLNYSPIPVQLANLTSLSILDLSDCNLQGSIPYLPQLKQLYVRSNPNLTVDLTWMTQHWPKLHTLSISHTPVIPSIPSSISNTSSSSLVNLFESYCSIRRSFPASITKLSHLQVLDLSSNKMTGHLPSSFSNLKEQQFLYLSENEFQGSIPESICKFSSIERLHLYDNNLTGRIPSCINNFQNLVVFDGARNSIGGYLKGDIPISICNLTNLISLDLSDNILIGEIPFCLFKLTNLADIDLSRNNLQGPMPLPPHGIKTFYLSENNLNGGSSMEAGRRLSNVRIVSLSGNKLSGSIPFSLCLSKVNDVGMLRLRSLDLSNNQLSGTLPSSLENCTDLTALQLNDNTLSGSFPNFIQRLEDLRILNLGNNNFVGSLPSFIGSLANLQILSLRSNALSGSIPEEIIYLQALQILDLSRNNFSGTIPKKIGNLTMLTSSTSGPIIILAGGVNMDVQLQMVIKGVMLRFERLFSYNLGIDLSFNILEGNIPEEIGLLKELATLSLSHNRLSGRIPKSVGNMSGLQSLDLSFNKLYGDIPQPLTLLDSLGYFNLSYNNLSGRVPRGPHFDTLSGDNGSAYIGNPLLCGVLTEKRCEGDPVPTGSIDDPTSMLKDEDGDDDAKEKLLFYGVVILGYGVGFWGLFFVFLIRKEKWWFGYWRLVDTVAVKLVQCVS